MQHKTMELPFPSIDVLSTEAISLNDGPVMMHSLPDDQLAQSLCSVVTGSTWQSNDPALKTKAKHADVFRATINSFGLPMAVILDGCGPQASPAEVQVMSAQLIRLLNEIAHEVQGTSLSEQAIIAKVKKKYRVLDSSLQYRFGSNASIAASIIYQDRAGQCKALSLGTGDAMITLDHGGTLSPLINAMNDEAGRPIPFPSVNVQGANIDTALKYLQITVRNVAPNDRLLFLTDGIYENLATQSVTTSDGVMTCRSLASHALLKAHRIQAIAEIVSDTLEKDFSSRSDANVVTLGDDATIAELHVPHKKLQLQCALWVALQAYIENRTGMAKLQNVALSESYFSLFSKWVTGTDGETKVDAATKMIRALHGEIVIFDSMDIRALRSSGMGRTSEDPGLGQIISKYDNKRGVLPDIFILSEDMRENPRVTSRIRT